MSKSNRSIIPVSLLAASAVAVVFGGHLVGACLAWCACLAALSIEPAGTDERLLPPDRAVRHDLQHSLDTLRIYADFLPDETRPRFKANISFMLELVYLFRDSHAIARGDWPLRPESFAVADEFKRISDLVDPIARNRNITVDWRAGRDLSLRTDRLSLRRILLNLVWNALDRTDGTKGMKRLAVGADRNGDGTIRLTVDDEGGGDAELVRAKLEGGHPDPDEKRYGHGLRICRELADRIDGRMQASPNGVVGVSVSLTLPAEGNP